MSHYPFEYFSTSECVANSPHPNSSSLLSCEQLSNPDSYVDWTNFDFDLASSTLPVPQSSPALVSDPSFETIFNPTGDNLNLWDPMQQNNTSLFPNSTLQSFDYPITTSELQSHFEHTPSAITPISSKASPDTPSTTTSNTSQKRSRPSSEPEQEPDKIDKRRRNNAAAAKYRQKKFDRIAELEGQLEDMAKDRDGLRLQLAKRDAEVEILRSMLAKK